MTEVITLVPAEQSHKRIIALCHEISRTHKNATDKHFLKWLRRQISPFAANTYLDGEYCNDPAHVRRAYLDGCGMGSKPPFSAIPLAHMDHVRQHQHGETGLVQHYGHYRDLEGDELEQACREFMDSWAQWYRLEWIKHVTGKNKGE